MKVGFSYFFNSYSILSIELNLYIFLCFIFKYNTLMSSYNPWHGCHKKSEGCLHCYIHKGDYKRGVDTNQIKKSDNFYRPIQKNKKNEYKMKSSLVYLCFESDFLLEEGDVWREDCWKMIQERNDCNFLFLTKRIERFMDCIPDDWDDGYDNVYVACTIENQKRADERLAIFQKLPIKHKMITAQPLIGPLDIEKYLDDIELVVVGGESDYHGRVMNYDWVLDIRNQCIRKNVSFEFRQCATHFVKDHKFYTLKKKDLMSQARKANINYKKI